MTRIQYLQAAAQARLDGNHLAADHYAQKAAEMSAKRSQDKVA